MGIKYKSESLYEFDIDGNGDHLHSFGFSMLNFASAVFENSNLILTGGSSSVNTGMNCARNFAFKANNETNALEYEVKTLSPMKQRRMKHCSIIMNNHIFVFFGHQNTLA
jgi:hypothetical protein